MTALDDQLQRTRNEEAVDTRHVLLLWFLRNMLGVEELDAYEYVFDSSMDVAQTRVDAAFISEAENPLRDGGVLNLIELKEQAGTSTEAADWVARRSQSLVVALRDDLARSTITAMLPSLSRTASRRVDIAGLQVRLHLLTLSNLTAITPPTFPDLEVLLHDRAQLERVARAIAVPSAVQTTISVEAVPSEILRTAIGGGDVFACPVKATEIVNWPGIEDRTLFDLNVRFELGSGRVRRSLDLAIAAQAQHANFFAFHNGLTVVCDEVREVNGGLEVQNISVVNGAQSVIAFQRNRGALTDELRVLVKFAAVGTTSPITREIAIKSNTQNPVNSRNLRALDPRQLVLQQEFQEDYAGYTYVLRPDVGLTTSAIAIANDEAAQLLCAVYNERPWLAVKRLSLFDARNYQSIFSPTIHAGHVVLSYKIHERVLAHRDQFPELYRGAWKLTALIATYLAGQALRSNDETKALLDAPDVALLDPTLEGTLDRAVLQAAAILQSRQSSLDLASEPDDYKVDFKRETALRELGTEARKAGLAPSPNAALG